MTEDSQPDHYAVLNHGVLVLVTRDDVIVAREWHAKGVAHDCDEWRVLDGSCVVCFTPGGDDGQ